MAQGTGKSGQQIAEEHVETLLAYIEGIEERREPLPRRAGELNRSEIARACGFDRNVLRTNPRCKALIDEADEKDRKANYDQLHQAEMRREEKSKTDRDRSALEEQNLRLMAENASLRREVERLRRVEDLMLHTGKTPV
ncbi:MAG TPA: hypothetical protein VM659_20125 [Dongiaceae bacterium]|nr:hypothetical protein [Dongiaceae bacterium]